MFKPSAEPCNSYCVEYLLLAAQINFVAGQVCAPLEVYVEELGRLTLREDKIVVPIGF